MGQVEAVKARLDGDRAARPAGGHGCFRQLAARSSHVGRESVLNGVMSAAQRRCRKFRSLPSLVTLTGNPSCSLAVMGSAVARMPGHVHAPAAYRICASDTSPIRNYKSGRRSRLIPLVVEVLDAEAVRLITAVAGWADAVLRKVRRVKVILHFPPLTRNISVACDGSF